MQYMKVYICSPYRGKTGKTKEMVNNAYEAIKHCRELVRVRPEMIPIAPHIYFPQFLDENVPTQRGLARGMARQILTDCKAVLVFGEVSEGMKEELITASKLGIPVYDGLAAVAGAGLVQKGPRFWEKEVGLPVLEGDEKRRAVVFPCKIGDTLWWVYDSSDKGDTEIAPTPPVKAIAMRADGKFLAAVTETEYENGEFDEIGGPTLYLTEEDALAEQARRRRRRALLTGGGK